MGGHDWVLRAVGLEQESMLIGYTLIQYPELLGVPCAWPQLCVCVWGGGVNLKLSWLSMGYDAIFASIPLCVLGLVFLC